MIRLDSNLVGREGCFGYLRTDLEKLDFHLGCNWDYARGCFDCILWREAGVTIYVRLPFRVVEGLLDEYNAMIQFQQPYIIKHVVNIGLDKDESSLLDPTGVNQFQKPKDPDDYINKPNKWERMASQIIDDLIDKIPI